MAIESTLCYKTGLLAETGYDASLDLRGKADGMLGVDAYANGGTAILRAKLEQKVGGNIKGGGGLELRLCRKLTGQTGVDAGVPIDATDPVVALLQDLTSSAGTSGLATVASAADPDGSRARQGTTLLSNLSPSSLTSPLSGGGSSSLAGAVPLPPDMRSRIEDPGSVLTEAPSIAQS